MTVSTLCIAAVLAGGPDLTAEDIEQMREAQRTARIEQLVERVRTARRIGQFREGPATAARAEIQRLVRARARGEPYEPVLWHLRPGRIGRLGREFRVESFRAATGECFARLIERVPDDSRDGFADVEVGRVFFSFGRPGSRRYGRQVTYRPRIDRVCRPEGVYLIEAGDLARQMDVELILSRVGD